MILSMLRNAATAGLFALLLTAGAAAELSPADRCESSKLKEAGKYGLCRLKAEARAVRTGEPPRYSKCNAKYSIRWLAIEAAGGGMCPSNLDRIPIRDFITRHTDDLAVALNGGPLADCPGDLATCNADLTTCNDDLATCLAQPTGRTLKTGQTTCYDAVGMVTACAGTGQDGELQKGLAVSYTDNGDGTITDNRTGLMWEKLSDDTSIHDKDANYNWNDAFAVKIAALNLTSFAGYTDWRLPNIRELHSLVDYSGVTPAVNAAFNTGCAPGCTVLTCSCTESQTYWTSTTSENFLAGAWFVDFNVGFVFVVTKIDIHDVRAVRGGS